MAARENAVSEKSIYELQDLVKKIALKEKIEESREFAGDVQESLHSGLAAQESGHPRPRSEESAVYRADRREHAVDSGGDFVLSAIPPTSTAWKPANTASALLSRSIVESRNMRMD